MNEWQQGPKYTSTSGPSSRGWDHPSHSLCGLGVTSERIFVEGSGMVGMVIVGRSHERKGAGGGQLPWKQMGDE